MENKERNLKDVEEILSLAKLSPQVLKPVFQALFFTNKDLDQHNYKLLQLDSQLLEEVNLGSKLYFKGEKDEEVVICSDTQTFHVVEAETSNSLLLTHGLKFNKDIENDVNEITSEKQVHNVTVNGIFYDYLDATIGKPHLKKLDNLLENSLYKGPEYESDMNINNLFSLEELCDKIQASKKEILDALNTMTVVEINEKIRTLDLEYHFRILTYMLKLVDENSWEFDEIDFKETIEALKSLAPKEIVENLFEKYTEESKEVDGVPLYKYREDKVCKFFAQILLHQTGKFNLNEFFQAWKESVPEGMVATEEMLYGIAIIDRKSVPNTIWAFEENSLPENINERLQILFSTKEKWTVPEISPYIKRLTTDKLDVNALLAKYARASRVDGIKYYSAKHGK